MLAGDDLVDALHDTGLGLNVITKAFAVSKGLSIIREERGQQTFRNAIGEGTRALGCAYLNLAFPDMPQNIRTYKCSVVKECPYPLVLGREFLAATRTLSSEYRDRFKWVPIHGAKMFKLMKMDTSCRQLSCRIGGEAAFATADTGSDVDLLSGAYAEARGHKVNEIPDGEAVVMLSDGSLKSLRGYMDLPLEVGRRISARRFYVLDGLTVDVILGDECLEEMDVYDYHNEEYLTATDGNLDDGFLNINWVGESDKVQRDVDNLISTGGLTQQAPHGRTHWYSRMSPARSAKKNASSAAQVDSCLMNHLQRVDDLALSEQWAFDQRIKQLTGQARQDTLASKAQAQKEHGRVRDLIKDMRGRLRSDGTFAPK